MLASDPKSLRQKKQRLTVFQLTRNRLFSPAKKTLTKDIASITIGSEYEGKRVQRSVARSGARATTGRAKERIDKLFPQAMLLPTRSTLFR